MKVRDLKKFLERCNDDADVVLEAPSGTWHFAYGEYGHVERAAMLVLEDGDVDVKPR